MLKIQAINPNSHKKNTQNRQTNKNTQIAQNPNFYASMPLSAYKTNAVSFGNAKKREDDYNLEPLDEIEDAMFNDEDFVYEIMFNKYAQDTFMTLSDNKPVIMQYTREDEAPELFLENLELVLKHGRAKKLGFTKEKVEFLTFDMGDYEPDEKDPFATIAKKVEEFKKHNSKKKPVLILRNFNSLMKYQKEPLKLLHNKVLKDNLYIGLDKVVDELDEDNFEFDYTKYPKIIKSFELNQIEPKDYEYLLERPQFVSKFITNGKALHINEKVRDKIIEVVEENGLDDWNYTPVDFIKDILAYRKLYGKRPDTISYNDVLKCVDYYDLRKGSFDLGNGIFDKTKVDSSEQSNSKSPDSTSKSKAKDEDDDEPKNTVYDIIKNVKTRFKDVGGMFNVKEQIREEFLDVIENPKVELKDMPTGILLSGPPGTGKTLLAKAIAGEAKLPFITAGGSDFVEMYVGVGAKRVRELFKEARKQAAKHPSKMAIVFIDEIDSSAKTRGANSSGEDDKTLNAILKEMDGVRQKDDLKEKVIVIAATNRKDILDKAVIRPGRFDIHCEIEDPSESKRARKEIVEIHSKKLEFEDDNEKEKILNDFVESSAGMSGAEIAETLKKSYRMTLSKKHKEGYITQADILESQLRVLAGVKTDNERADFALESTIQHEAGHGLLAVVMNKVFENANPRLKPLFDIDFITNEGRGKYGGAMYHKHTDTEHWTFESIISKIAVSYAGGSVEKILLGGNASGCSSDLKNVTNMINFAVQKYGLGPNTGRKGFDEKDEKTPELFKENIKKDFEMMATLGEEISNDVVKFSKGFLDFYIKEFRENPKMRTEIITGDRFKDMLNTWLEKENKKQEYEALCAGINDKIQYAKENGELRQQKAGYINAINNPYQYNSNWTTSYS